MKHFSKIILFFVICLFTKAVCAQTYRGTATLLSDLDIGTILLTNPSSAYIKGFGDSATPEIGGLQLQGYSRGQVSETSTVRLAAAKGVTAYIGGTSRNFYDTVLTCENTSNTLSMRVQFGTFTGTLEIGVPNDTFHIGTRIMAGAMANFGSYEGTCSGSLSFNLGYKSSGTLYYMGDITLPIHVRFTRQLSPIEVSKTQDLNFGTISTTSAHNVTINPNGCNISSTVPSGLISTASARCGIFTIKNEGSSAQALTSVTLPSSVTLSGSNGGSFSVDVTSSPNVSTISSVGANTTLSVNVGGTLHVLGGEPVGTYTGNYTITVNY